VSLKAIHEPWLGGNSDGEADRESHLPPSSSSLFPACVHMMDMLLLACQSLLIQNHQKQHRSDKNIDVFS
jgi:hypothetical protein